MPQIAERTPAKLHFIRQPEVLKRTALSRSTLYELIAKERFPKPLKVGERINCWPEHEVDAWMQEQVAGR
ncbi:helix-turn-helix transcriptional regulator [Novosphingobium humi]|uniref:AlpA family phage regulatory protein n=1 Tax=Novosphingobium humi TaxID=2282397 RepID=A0ABY7TTJ0_9SPHN|nr:AlpA family phage regulatory protein [Novosphingobium humi]WCT76328.1 AlpA family phage regulatory protein [Novosphingobium humi]